MGFWTCGFVGVCATILYWYCTWKLGGGGFDLLNLVVFTIEGMRCCLLQGRTGMYLIVGR
jgi:hypothetical protein